jgi:hypothetical protein
MIVLEIILLNESSGDSLVPLSQPHYRSILHPLLLPLGSWVIAFSFTVYFSNLKLPQTVRVNSTVMLISRGGTDIHIERGSVPTTQTLNL